MAGTDGRGVRLDRAYDLLDRPVALTDHASESVISSWGYDTAGKGLPYSATTYDDGAAWTVTTTGYDNADRPTGQTVSVPAAAGTVAGTYATSLSYWPGGLLRSQSLPAAAGLPAEMLTFGYNQLGLPVGVGNGHDSYLDGALYTQYSQLAQTVRSPGSGYVIESYTYDQPTGRLTGDLVQRVAAQYATIARHFLSWQPSGLLIGDVNNVPQTGVDKQCYTYDHNQQLTAAWTPPVTAQCATGPAAGLAGPAPYWQQWAFDPAGSRTSHTTNPTTTGGPTLTDTYTHPATGPAHAIGAVTHTSSTGGAPTTDTYAYNPAGAATTRPGQALTYDPAGRLTDITTTAGTEHRVYTPDGQLLHTTGPTGAGLYLTGQADTILTTTTGGDTVGQRTYRAGTITAAQRTSSPAGGSAVTITITDPVTGTTTAGIDTTPAMTATHTYTDPYGNPRGNTTWPGPTGYLNKPHNPALGLTRLGVRDYDPTLGAFTTVDPILAPTTPTQNNGYTYATNNPLLHQDPNGTCPILLIDNETCGQASRRAWQHQPATSSPAAPPAAAAQFMPMPGQPAAQPHTYYSAGAQPGASIQPVPTGASGALMPPPPHGDATIGVVKLLNFVWQLTPGPDAISCFNGHILDCVMAAAAITVVGKAGSYAAKAVGAVGNDIAAETAGGGGGKLVWTSWQSYPKVTQGGREYAQIGDRLYTQHAVDRMQPSGLGAPAGTVGAGRSVSPNFVEDVLTRTRGVPVKGPNGEARMSYTSGTVQVITEDNIVITVMTR